MSAAESLGSHQLNSFAAFLEENLHTSSETSKVQNPQVRKMADGKRPHEGGKKPETNTSFEIPEDIYDEYCTPDEAKHGKETCRGVDTADVLEQGLSRRAIALGSLKGLIGTKDTRESFYTSSAPYDEGKSVRLVEIGIAEVSISKRLNSPAWLSTWLFLALNRHRVIPLYTRADA